MPNHQSLPAAPKESINNNMSAIILYRDIHKHVEYFMLPVIFSITFCPSNHPITRLLFLNTNPQGLTIQQLYENNC